MDEFDGMHEAWKSRDRVNKVLGMFSAPRLYSDWEIAETNEVTRRNATWEHFKTTMEGFYAPTENTTLSHFQFRNLAQDEEESFPTFCIRVEKEAKSCHFKCQHADCTAETTAVRDQILIGTINNQVRTEALLKGWNLPDLRTEGTKIESASRSEAEISGGVINKVSKYNFSNLKNKKRAEASGGGSLTCFNCAENFKGPPVRHKMHCKAKDHICDVCGRQGHLEKCCRRARKDVKQTTTNTSTDESSEDLQRVSIAQSQFYDLNIFRVNIDHNAEHDVWSLKAVESDFKVEVVINGAIDTVTADTGAKVSVCGKAQARKWNLLKKMTRTSVQIKPYNSPAVPAAGVARCSVTFGHTSIPVCWYILDGSCEPILSGSAATNLGIIHFTKQPPIYKPINMINEELENQHREAAQHILAKNSDVFIPELGKH